MTEGSITRDSIVENDGDIIARLNPVGNKQGCVKSLTRKGTAENQI